jgi:FMN phosphatase YigB (HAD superfamily)
MKIFIDLDDVILNTKEYKKALRQIFLKNGIPINQFEASYYTLKKIGGETEKYYNPKDQIRRLKKNFKTDVKKMEKEVDGLLSHSKKYLFSDAEWFLKQFKKKDLFLVTYGHERVQSGKIEGAKIGKYFKKIVISRKNKFYEIFEIIKRISIEKNETVMFIDDNPEYLQKIEKKYGFVKTFHMRRPEGRYLDETCKDADFEVNNLREVARIIKKEKMT